MKSKYLPIFSLSVKTEVEEQQRAQLTGFSTIITKPIDSDELESKISRTINLDFSGRYFDLDDGVMMVKLSKKCYSSAISELGIYLKTKTSEAADFGISHVIFDTQQLQGLYLEVVRLLLQSMRIFQELSPKYAIAGNSKVIEESKKH